MGYSRQDVLNSIAVIVVFTVISTVLFLILSFQLFCGRRQKRTKSTRINVVTKLLVFLCVTVSTVCEWADLSRHIICYVEDRNLYFYPMNNIMGSADLLYYLGAIIFYSIAISRLQISFHGSQYAIPCVTVSFFYTLMGTVCGCIPFVYVHV